MPVPNPGLGLTRAQAQAVDRIALQVFGIAGLVLMENAGLLAALRCMQLRVGHGPVLVLCGAGNNGGDGLVLARQLALRSIETEVLLSKQPHGDAAVQLDILRATGQAVHLMGETSVERLCAIRQVDWSLIVDAVLGTGFQGCLRACVRPILGLLGDVRSRRAAPVVALDLPSGLDCDSGHAAEGTVAVDRTLTFAARKRAFDQPACAVWTGPVEVLPIGVPDLVIDLAREGSPIAGDP